MPFDFTNLKTYHINYQNLCDHFKKFSIMDDAKLNEQYLTRWITTLQAHDHLLVSYLDTKEKILAYQQSQEEDRFFFVQYMTYGGISVLIQFEINKIHKEIDFFRNTNGVIEIPIEYFFNKKFGIHWNKRDAVFSKKFNPNPIYIVPFFTGKSCWLVIDGNHRITQAIEEKHETISSIILDGKFLSQKKIFPSCFDFLFYTFQNEFSNFDYYKKVKFFTDEMLYDNSFLSLHDFNI